MHVAYSWRGIKFGGLAVYIITAKLKSAKISYSHIQCIRMAIPYRTAKFKFANILAIAILGSTAKFNPANISGYTLRSNYCKLRLLYTWYYTNNVPTSPKSRIAFLKNREACECQLTHTHTHDHMHIHVHACTHMIICLCMYACHGGILLFTLRYNK